MTIQTEGVFLSSDRIHQIPYVIHTPTHVIPKGIVQIIHGMSESGERYERMGAVEALTEGGFVVCRSDHLGHGGAVSSTSEYGDVPSSSALMKDLRTLRTIVRGKYRYLPYFVLGHSMGSFLAREWIMTAPEELNGAILMGTTSGDGPVNFGKFAASLLSHLGFGRVKAPLFQKIMNAQCNRSLKPGSEGDWLACASVADFDSESPHPIGFPFTVRGYAALFGLMKKISTEESIAEMPRSVPIFLVSGEEDPVGGMGDGIRRLYDMLFEAGVDDLQMKLYPNARHEILREPCREEVLTDILNWLDAECEHHVKERSWNPLG